MAFVASHKKAFLKEAIIGFGFLSGLWVKLGFDPGTFVRNLLEEILLRADPAHEKIIVLAFTYIPLLITIFAVLLIYRRAGWFGFIATGLAYLAGLVLSIYSIPLLIGALIIGFFAARR